MEQKVFPFQVLVSATKDFHSTHKLGEGGFGPVFKVISIFDIPRSSKFPFLGFWFGLIRVIGV